MSCQHLCCCKCGQVAGCQRKLPRSSTTYGWVISGGRDGTTANKDWQRRSVKGKTQVYQEGNFTVEEYTMGFPAGNHAIWTPTGALTMLTPVLNQGLLPGGTTLGEERCLHPPVRGNAAASVTPIEFFPPITYYPTHRKKLALHKGYRTLQRC